MLYTLEGVAKLRYIDSVIRAAAASVSVLRNLETDGLCPSSMMLRFETLLRLCQVIDIRYRSSDSSVRVEMDRSGFLSTVDLKTVEYLVETAKIKLPVMPPLSVLKERWVNYLFETGSISSELMRSVSDRYLFESALEQPVFTDRSISDAVTVQSVGRRGLSEITWSGYDPARDVPFVFSMQYESDSRAGEYNIGAVIARNCAWRPAGVIGAVIDDALEQVHPKSVQAYGIRRLITHDTLIPGDMWSDALRDNDASGKGFILFLRHEVAQSSGESSMQHSDTKQSVIRERWYTPVEFPNLRNDLAAVRRDFIVMPHSVSQFMSPLMKSDSARIVTIKELQL
jgi:hypothetical protein